MKRKILFLTLYLLIIRLPIYSQGIDLETDYKNKQIEFNDFILGNWTTRDYLSVAYFNNKIAPGGYNNAFPSSLIIKQNQNGMWYTFHADGTGLSKPLYLNEPNKILWKVTPIIYEFLSEKRVNRNLFSLDITDLVTGRTNYVVAILNDNEIILQDTYINDKTPIYEQVVCTQIAYRKQD